ncbi:two-component sensor histidine kinase [Lutibacter oceani]|uniref:histidine kinase n=1 Tax=Lutibacter oceani TaxID=1853311 RepID=A0A3D9RPG3_9FLAO|nr:histidine kinase dimerization/phosphoacceptor domain -containing protein [Lutibacter oceani]REE81823.1 two-component sensor histidine kinase [Lutibacter oceani]
MKKDVLTLILTGVFFIFNHTFCYSQIIDLNNKNPYKKVFVETDNFGASYLNILEDAFDKVDNDTIQFSILNDLAYYWHTRNLITALDFTKNGIKLSKEKNNTLWLGRFQITQGAILLRMEKLDSAFSVLQDAKSMVKVADLPFLNTQLGYVFERKGQLDKAADYVLESLRLGEKLNDNKAIALAYSDLSNLFWKQAKFEKGLEYGLKSIEVFEERGINDLDYDFTLYVVGNNYLDLKKYEEALNYYEHAIIVGERYGFYNNLSDVYISLVDLNTYLNQFDKAEESGVNAIKYAELLDNNFMLMRSWLSVGKMQNLQGKYQTAIESLQKCIEIATDDFGDNYYLSKAYEALGRAFAGNHSYKEAYQAFAEYDKLKNELFTVEADQRISLLQTEFDVNQKDNTILKQESKIKEQKITQTLIIIISSLLFLILIILYITYKIDKKKSNLLEKQNKEKEFLLKEIHHRVKNNLEIISSLLSLQAAQIDDTNIINAIQVSQNRVYSISMIHQRLYQGKKLGLIEMKDYLIYLGSHILESFGFENSIELDYQVDFIELDIDTSIPLGLIVNELLTNSFKYAFPNNRKGKIIISLKKIDQHSLLLKITDNGIGINENEKNTGFGTQLINLLTQQLDGELKLETNGGTSISLKFKV